MGQEFAGDHQPTRAPVQDWVGLSGMGLLDPNADGALTRGLFVIEFALPLTGSTLIMDHQTQGGTAHSFGIFFDPAAGIAISHRQGARVCKHRIAGPLPLGDGVARLTLQFFADGWTLTYQILGARGAQKTAKGSGAMPIQFADMAQICATKRRHAAVLWFGFSMGADLPQPGAWIGQNTPVQTSLGAVAAGNLRAGDVILTEDCDALPLRSVRRAQMPARGTYAPVLLRAPFFGASNDLLVSGSQQIMVASGEVEYLFGADAVLIAAKDLIDGGTAMFDDRRPVAVGVFLDLGQAALIDTGGLVMALGQDAGFDDLPILKRFEVATLMAMLRRSGARTG